MKTLFVVMLVIVITALSCGNVAQSTNSLGSMLSSIPSELASNSVLWFNNIEKIKKLAGVESDIAPNDFINAATEHEVVLRRMELMAGLTLSGFDGGMYLEEWSKIFGYDMFDIDQEIWAENWVQPNSTHPLCSVMKGHFDKNNITDKLQGIGYQLKKYSSNEYYSINADHQTGEIRSSQTARMSMAFLNRMQVQEQDIIAAPADDEFFSVLDVRSGKQTSLKDLPAYTRTSEELGDILGAALIPRSMLRSNNVNSDWGKIGAYALIGIGYLVEGQERKMVIILYYPDKSALADIDEMKHRLAEYSITAGNAKTSLLSDLFIIGKPEATVLGTDSIMKIELKYKPETMSILWSDMVAARDLGFLIADPLE